MKYVYEAMDKMGLEFQDFVEAESQDDAQVQIRRKGLFVTKLTMVKGPFQRPSGESMKLYCKVAWLWYDLWVGFYWDRVARALYFCPLPTIVFKFYWE